MKYVIISFLIQIYISWAYYFYIHIMNTNFRFFSFQLLFVIFGIGPVFFFLRLFATAHMYIFGLI